LLCRLDTLSRRAQIALIGAFLGDAMQVHCSSVQAASQVRAILMQHGISRINQRGPFINRKQLIEIWITVMQTIDPSDEPTLQREIDSILGATVHN
jgi:hypothetical protein